MWAVIKLDETRNWENGDPNTVKSLGRLAGVYVTDLDRRVHCCELTPSYELHFIETQWSGNGKFDGCYLHGDDEWEKLDDYVRDGDMNTDVVTYMHCRTIDGFDEVEGDILLTDGQGGSKCLIDIDDEELDYEDEELDYEERLENALETVRGGCY